VLGWSWGEESERAKLRTRAWVSRDEMSSGPKKQHADAAGLTSTHDREGGQGTSWSKVREVGTDNGQSVGRGGSGVLGEEEVSLLAVAEATQVCLGK
jgi:hypothetical protein